MMLSATISKIPDWDKSDIMGRLSCRCSTPLDTWDQTRIGASISPASL